MSITSRKTSSIHTNLTETSAADEASLEKAECGQCGSKDSAVCTKQSWFMRYWRVLLIVAGILVVLIWFSVDMCNKYSCKASIYRKFFISGEPFNIHPPLEGDYRDSSTFGQGRRIALVTSVLSDSYALAALVVAESFNRTTRLFSRDAQVELVAGVTNDVLVINS